MRPYRYVLVDVFTEAPLAGNALAVFTDARDIPEDRLQRLAREMNLSETVFVFPRRAEGHARIRIFTPAREVPFAGHPTLGAAFVIGGALDFPEIRLETLMGVVPVRLEREGGRVLFGRMSQPLPTVEPFAQQDELARALGVAGSLLPVERYDNGIQHVYVRLGSEAEVAGLKPDFSALRRLDATCFSCFAGEGRRFKTRMFAPRVGVDEDPATGSAAGPLAVHLARHGRLAYGDEIEIAQGAEVGRPSTLYARVAGSAAKLEAVEVGGAAVVVARGEFRLQ